MQKLQHSMVAPARANLLAKQKGLCAICGINIVKEGKQAVLDHDHESGVCRGVLCNNCNGLEGKVKNLATRAKREGTFLEWLLKLIAYLQHHAVPRTNMIHPTHKSAEEKRVLRNKKARVARQLKRVSTKPKETP